MEGGGIDENQQEESKLSLGNIEEVKGPRQQNIRAPRPRSGTLSNARDANGNDTENQLLNEIQEKM